MTASRSEARVAERLNRILVAVALPQVRVVARRRFRGSVFRVVESVVPRLPCYLFARISDRHLWLVKEIEGILAVVNAMGVPLRVPDDVVDEIMRGCDESGVVEVRDYTRPQALGRPGDPVAVQWPGNPYDGFIGSLAALEGKRVRLWLKTLGGERSVRIPIERVRPAARTPLGQLATAAAG